MIRFRLVSAAALPAALWAATTLAGGAHARDLTVTPQWLSAHLNDPDLVLLQVGDRGDYDRNHIAGARYVSLDDIAVDSGGLSLQMPAPADLQARLEKLGISDGSRIVVYSSDPDVSPATRVVFTLYAAGLGERVSLLDGGLGQWRGPAGDTKPQVRAGHLTALHPLPVVVDRAFVKAHLTAPGYDIIDARARVFYDGVRQGGPMMHMKRGHIPGARSVPFLGFDNGDMTLKSADQDRGIFAAAGIKPGDHLIVYCHIGQQATEVLFAARRAGIDAVLYDGSFEDWAIHDEPVAAGK